MSPREPDGEPSDAPPIARAASARAAAGGARVDPDVGEGTYVGYGRLDGQKALITSGGGWLGRAVALAFAREGADVAITHGPDEHADAAATIRLVASTGRSAVAIEADLADPSQCERAIAEASRALGGLTVLINDAGARRPVARAFEDLEPERVLRTCQRSIVSMFTLVRAALAHLAPGAAVINVAHGHGAARLDDAVARGAIVAFTRGIARELAVRGIRVNCVARGAAWPAAQPGAITAPDSAPWGAQPAELASAFVFLASDESRHVSGEVLGVAPLELVP